ncbi:hypothetical protein M5J20_02525 [Corynebacterium sp. TA-R-1]|uniref:TIGR04086 family membrane protein n=1 Tax=Corynebacterium stercoris TaxID=2943490 RepID=A0ABT1FZN7_9CORY|nr:hypothetical protein [Corynebacterium stercoris]MCP1387067.1 hypothetical protein [Corynebacterium stercoris]
MVPIQLRAGGAFIALALVLFLFAFVAFLRGDTLYTITPQFICTAVAAVIFGSFATFNTAQGGSRKQLIALGAAVLLLGLGVLVPNTALAVTPTYWLGLWAVGALLCALILRRSAM